MVGLYLLFYTTVSSLLQARKAVLQNLLKKHKNTISARQLYELARYELCHHPISSMRDHVKQGRELLGGCS